MLWLRSQHSSVQSPMRKVAHAGARVALTLGRVRSKRRLPSAVLSRWVVAASLSVLAQRSRSGGGFFYSIPPKLKLASDGMRES